MIPFFPWLLSQSRRRDAIGQFAVWAAIDPAFPRDTNRLSRLLRYYDLKTPLENSERFTLRDTAKRAHAEWRKTR